MSRTAVVPVDATDENETSDDLSWPPKDPDELLDYYLDWSTRLDSGDQIATSNWAYPGLTNTEVQEAGFTLDTHQTKVWLSGGVEGKQYRLTNTVTTDGLRTYEQSVYIRIKSR